MSREQMEAAGYGLHHQSDDGKYLISYEIQENDENPVIILAEK